MLRLRRLPLWLTCMALGGGSLSAIAQTNLPLLLKGYALLVPLQAAALLYVYWFWRQGRPPASRSLDP